MVEASYQVGDIHWAIRYFAPLLPTLAVWYILWGRDLSPFASVTLASVMTLLLYLVWAIFMEQVPLWMSVVVGFVGFWLSAVTGLATGDWNDGEEEEEEDYR